jgi:hypothetical protein
MTITAPLDGGLLDPAWAVEVTDALNSQVPGLAALTATVSALSATVSALTNPARAQLRQTSAQTLGSGTGAVCTYNAEDKDSANGHSIVTNTSRYTCQVAGDYFIQPAAGFAANVTGVRAVNLRVNGSDVAGSQNLWSASSGFATSMPGRGVLITLAVNDFVEALLIQNSGGNLNTDVGTTTQSTMTVIRIA